MFAIYKDFSLNFIYVLFAPAVFFAIIRRIREKKGLYTLSLATVFTVSLVSTMSVPVNINGLASDFRAIPLTIGSLYGGMPVCFLLYLVLIIYRYLMGNSNQLEYIVSIIPTMIFVVWIIRKYPALTVQKKVVSAIATYFVIRAFTLVVYLLLTNSIGSLFETNFSETMTVVVFQSIITGAYVYALEYLERVMHFREEIIHTEKLKLVSGIAASVAHEVRNPLTSVRGFIQLLGREDLNRDNREYYQKICLEELDRAQQIISDYLSLAKPDPEKTELIQLNAEVHYVANVLQSYAKLQNVQINVHTSSHSLQLIGEKAKFRQALINLCKNSIEAMPRGGILTIETLLQSQQKLIRIRDTGIGMTKEQLSRLGTPFYSTKEKGTGLGTMVSFSIIRNLKGTIRTSSEVGKGSTFEIVFPVAREAKV